MRKFNTKEFIKKYIVAILFLALSLFFMIATSQPVDSVARDLLKRLSRNSFIVLSLIIPVVAGMGINFAITIGAMAAQIGLLLSINFQQEMVAAATWIAGAGAAEATITAWTGVISMLFAGAITLVLGTLFGFLIGKLLNRMKGQETIGSMILGYFANGAYQLLFLYIFGGIIPLRSHVTIIGATGVKNTLSLIDFGLSQAIDGLWKVPFRNALFVVCGIILAGAVVLMLCKKITLRKAITLGASAVALALIMLIPAVARVFEGQMAGQQMKLPVVTWILILLLCGFNFLIMRTKLGQQFRAVGQSQTVANASGINVNRTRLIAIMISTVLAGWGQIIYLQSDGMGTLATYAAHEQVGLYAGAALLVGGASIDRASNKQALLGTFLFHFMFLTTQKAASDLFGDAVIGEYFRAFLSYAVIAVALVMYAWKGSKRRQPRNAIQDAGPKDGPAPGETVEKMPETAQE